MLVPTNDIKEKIETYEEIWSKIRDLVGSITKKSDEYDMMKNMWKSNLI